MNRKKTNSLIDDLPDLFAALPWWIGPVAAFTVFAAFYWIFPALVPTQDAPDAKIPTAFAVQSIWVPILRTVAPGAACLVLLAWLVALGKKFSNRRLLDRQNGLETIRDLNWQEFETLLGEAFRRQGYGVERAGGKQPDGGVDLRLRRDSKTSIVQCKHWRERKVGVKVVRELLGVVVSERADEGVLVTAGSYTQDAIEFANRNAIRLIDGTELEHLIREVQQSPQDVSPSKISAKASTPPTSEPLCPLCNLPMVKRIAKKGANAGKEFWGCAGYPACKGTRKA